MEVTYIFPLYHENNFKPYYRLREGLINYYDVWSRTKVMDRQFDALFHLYNEL
jgi:hypothetical protein